MKELLGRLALAGLMGILITGCGKARLIPKVKIIDQPAPQDDDGADAEAGPIVWPSFPVVIFLDERLSDFEREAVKGAVGVWEKAIGREIAVFKPSPTKNTADLDSDASPLYDGLSGLYLIDNWFSYEAFDRKTIASTSWRTREGATTSLEAADILFNTQGFYFVDAEKTDEETLDSGVVDGRNVVDFQTVAAHEFGHFLGLKHDPTDTASIMYPTIPINIPSFKKRDVSENDRAAIRALYGCEGEGC